jgi:uncharacterized protein YegP (UPF0339 family)
MSNYLTVEESARGKNQLKLKGLNGELVMHGEEYFSKSNAKRAIEDFENIVIEHLKTTGRFEQICIDYLKSIGYEEQAITKIP